jgi:hypothetical protein
MAVLLVLHFAFGAALGAFFRIGIMLLALAAIVAEAMLGWFDELSLPSYVVAILALIAVQAGYACAAYLRPVARPARSGQEPTPPMHNLPTPK